MEDAWSLQRILYPSDGGEGVTETMESRVVLNNGKVVAGSFNKRDQLKVGNGPVYYYDLPYERHRMDC